MNNVSAEQRWQKGNEIMKIKNIIFLLVLIGLTLAGFFAAVFFVEAKLNGISISNSQGIILSGDALTSVVNEIMKNVAVCALVLGVISLLFNLLSYFVKLSHVKARIGDIIFHIVISAVIVLVAVAAQIFALYVLGNNILNGYNYSPLGVSDSIISGVVFGVVTIILSVGTCWYRMYRYIHNRTTKAASTPKKEIPEDSEL